MYITDNVGFNDLYLDSISCHLISVSLSELKIKIVGDILSPFFSLILFLLSNFSSSKGGKGLLSFLLIFVLS